MGEGLQQTLQQKRYADGQKKEHELSVTQSLLGNHFLPVNQTEGGKYHREVGEAGAPEP